MKTSVKIWIAGLLVLALLMAVGAVFLVRHALLTGNKDKSGWTNRGGAVLYLNKDGNPTLGWQEIEGKRYYFVPDAGIRATGWVQINDGLYYFGADGVLMTGWQEINGRKYYLGDNGMRATGLLSIDGKGYYFDKTGVMATGWQLVNDVPCYYADNGAAVPGWQEISGTQYYFRETGEVLIGWNTLDDSLYYFTSEGRTLSGWQTLEEKQYYFTEEGYVLTGWQILNSTRYCFDAEGAVVNGWFEDESGKYYMVEGVPLIGKQTIEDNMYYFDEEGVAVTGWFELEGETYYAKETGELAVGQITLEGVNYFFTSQGCNVLVVNKDNAIPEGYVPDLENYRGFKINTVARDPLAKMIASCPYSTTIDNIYRSEETQKGLWTSGINKRIAAGMTYEEAEADTARTVMPAGHSEHHTGLAVDMFGSDLARQWLEEHCWEYGFIVRYPEGKYEYTGIDYEYWHFRYVGTALSMELKELDMCLEEYMQMLTK